MAVRYRQAPRMVVERSIRVVACALVALFVAACVGAAPGPSESGSRVGTENPGASVEATSSATPSPSAKSLTDGQMLVAHDYDVGLKVTVDRTTVEPGGAIEFVAEVRNDRSKPLPYYMPYCGGAASLTLTLDLPLKPSGKTWSGVAASYKQYAIEQGYGAGGVPATKPITVDARPEPCKEDQGERTLGPGDSVVTRVRWPAQIVAGVDAMPGDVPYEISTSFDPLITPPTLDPSRTGPIGSWKQQYHHVKVSGGVHVIGPTPPSLSIGQAIDSMLSNAKFERWLEQQPVSSWSNANVFLESQDPAEGIIPEGASWDVELFREPRNWAIGFVDPITGAIRSVTYCNIPCDR
jgi:hypothetical protein